MCAKTKRLNSSVQSVHFGQVNFVSCALFGLILLNGNRSLCSDRVLQMTLKIRFVVVASGPASPSNKNHNQPHLQLRISCLDIFQDRSYTIMMIDPDYPHYTTGQFYLHWLVTNIPVSWTQHEKTIPTVFSLDLLFLGRMAATRSQLQRWRIHRW